MNIRGHSYIWKMTAFSMHCIHNDNNSKNNNVTESSLMLTTPIFSSWNTEKFSIPAPLDLGRLDLAHLDPFSIMSLLLGQGSESRHDFPSETLKSACRRQ